MPSRNGIFQLLADFSPEAVPCYLRTDILRPDIRPLGVPSPIPTTFSLVAKGGSVNTWRFVGALRLRECVVPLGRLKHLPAVYKQSQVAPAADNLIRVKLAGCHRDPR